MNLKEYINNWNSLEIKPENEYVFIDLFVDYLGSIDNHSDVHFEGEGAYFGKQVSVYKDRNYMGDNTFNFEIAYDKNHIRVYTGNHNGFWTPEYMDISSAHKKWDKVSGVFFPLLREVFCV